MTLNDMIFAFVAIIFIAFGSAFFRNGQKNTLKVSQWKSFRCLKCQQFFGASY